MFLRDLKSGVKMLQKMCLRQFSRMGIKNPFLELEPMWEMYVCKQIALLSFTKINRNIYD